MLDPLLENPFPSTVLPQENVLAGTTGGQKAAITTHGERIDFTFFVEQSSGGSQFDCLAETY
jgi:hypothetical protein